MALALVATAALWSPSALADPLSSEPPPPAGAPVDRPSEEATGFRVGALAGVGFPRPLAIEAMVKLDRVAAFGVEYSLLPETSVYGVEAKLSAISADARVFPFQNAFFIGLRAGHQTMKATATANLGVLGSYSQSAEAETWFVNPRIGALWTMRSGFSIGVDVGVHIPISPSLSTTLPDGLPFQIDAGIASVAGALGNNVTPTIDLLRVGVLF